MIRKLCIFQKQWQKGLRLNQRFYAQKAHTFAKPSVEIGKEEPEEKNEPLKFFGSQASIWRAQQSRSGGAEEALWYQPYVISLSLAIFLIYFCILREENDIDLKLQGSLYDQVSGLEELSLAVAYKYNKDHGLDTKEVENRLTELGVDINSLKVRSVAAK